MTGNLTPYFAAALLATMACQDVPLPPTAAPTFVAPERATAMQGATVRMPPGESLTWSVRYRGMPVGTATLQVRGDAGGLRVESRFQTIGVAAQIRPVTHRLITSLAPTPVPFEDVHSALGRVRAWASARARPATLRVRHAGRRYLLKLAQPLLDHGLSTPTWRIEAEATLQKRSQATLQEGSQATLQEGSQARSQAILIKMTLWLSTDANRVPLQMTITQRGQQIRAQLLEVGES